MLVCSNGDEFSVLELDNLQDNVVEEMRWWCRQDESTRTVFEGADAVLDDAIDQENLKHSIHVEENVCVIAVQDFGRLVSLPNQWLDGFNTVLDKDDVARVSH